MVHMNVAIIDDEQLVINNLIYLLRQFPDVSVVLQSTQVLDALGQIQESENIDVVFMDISMPALNGIEAASRVFGINSSIKIIFLTAYEQYAIESFQANTVDYIIKPVTAKRLQHSLNKLDSLLQAERKGTDRIEVPKDAPQTAQHEGNKVIGFKENRFYVLDTQDIFFITMNGKTVVCYTRNDSYILKHSLAHWEKRLSDKGFIRCHRAYIVNTNHVEAFAPMFNSTYTITLDGRDEEIVVSRSYVDNFRGKFLGG